MTGRPSQRGLLCLKWEIVTDVLFLFSFSFLKPREEGRRDSAVLAYWQDSSFENPSVSFYK